MYKLMVVDDEQMIRDGIINFIINSKIEFEVVGEAADGKQALEMMPELMPEVIITDICMPLLDGIEFIESAKLINPDLKVIIVSGYDDFEYAQKALRLGVFDYLLKPVQADRLVDILQRIKEELDEHRDLLRDITELKKRFKMSLPVMRDRFFQELMTGKVKPEELAEKLQSLDLTITGQLYAVALIKMKNLKSANKESIKTEGLLQCYMTQITENMFPDYIKPYVFFQSGDRMVVLFAVSESDRQKVFIALNQNLKRVIISAQRSLSIDAYASLGKLYNDLAMIYQSYNEAEEAIQFSLLQEKGSVVNYEDINTQKDRQYKRPIEIEKQLLTQVKLGEKQQVPHTIQMLLDYYRGGKDIEPSRIKLLLLEITVLLVRTVEETGGSGKNVFKNGKITPYEQVEQCETLADMQEFFCEFVMKCLEEIEKVRVGRGYTIVEKAKEIIETSLENHEFSLDDVAGRLFISPNYLRNLFKQQVGETFVEYLTRHRMEKAIELLDDPSLKIHQIAEQVGYIDQHYFSICFKKFFGLTPTEYREAKMVVEN